MTFLLVIDPWSWFNIYWTIGGLVAIVDRTLEPKYRNDTNVSFTSCILVWPVFLLVAFVVRVMSIDFQRVDEFHNK